MDNQRWPWQKEVLDTNFFVNEPVYTKAYLSTYSSEIDVSGYVEAYQTQDVKIRATGAVTGVFVKEGDRVTKGQLLATIDSTDQNYSVARLEQELEVKKISGTSSARDIELLEMQLESAIQKLENTKAYANFDGVVISVSIEEGDYFDAGQAVMTIIDDSKLKASVEIDEIDIQVVKVGDIATLSSDSAMGESFEGYVSYIPMIGRYSNQGIGVMDVELTIENAPSGLKPGFSFEGTIGAESEQSLLLVPQAAVTTSRGVSTVEKVMEDGSTQKTTVVVKYLGENVYQIVSGDVVEGDTLVYYKKSVAGSIGSVMTTMPSMDISIGGGSPMGGGQMGARPNF
ncbi:MAG: efflux RND transporter periplasmic adaptor subunit [Sphaerochaetaceae bacterium]|nr:efflux RND transporter periplasmic adaptor subunit [Sphaerochaetaceae bacterium]